MTSDRTRFDLTAYPLPKNAQGKTFFDKSPGYVRVKRAFRQLIEDPGLGVLTAEAGVGKTASLRNLCTELPRPDHLVLYPSHYSGSVCGRGLSANPISTLGFERRTNGALQHDSEDAFVEASRWYRNFSNKPWNIPRP